MAGLLLLHGCRVQVCSAGSQLPRQPGLIPSWASICFDAWTWWFCWSFILHIPGYCRGKGGNPKPWTVRIKPITLDIYSASTSSVWQPKVPTLRIKPVCRWLIVPHDDFKESCSAVHFLGLGNFPCISLHTSHTAPPYAVSFITVRGDHPCWAGDHINTVVQLCWCFAILLTRILWDALRQDISACLRSTIKTENKLAGISFELFLSDLLWKSPLLI